MGLPWAGNPRPYGNGGQCPPYNYFLWDPFPLFPPASPHPDLAGPAKPQGQGGRFVEAGPEGLDEGLGVPAHVHPVGE